jgi:hypothetical protein
VLFRSGATAPVARRLDDLQDQHQNMKINKNQRQKTKININTSKINPKTYSYNITPFADKIIKKYTLHGGALFILGIITY